MQRMMKAKEVAEYTQIPLQMVYRKTRSGEMPCYRIGRSIRYKIDEVEASMKGGHDAKK
jgi:excisionase family DNA binding protein